MIQEGLDRVYLSEQCDTFKINNVLVYHFLLKIFTNMDAYTDVKQTKSMHNGWAEFFNLLTQFIDPDHVARQAADTEWKLQNSHYDGEKKG